MKHLIITASFVLTSILTFGQWTDQGSNMYTADRINQTTRIYLPYSSGNNYIRAATNSDFTYFDGQLGVGIGHQSQYSGYALHVHGLTNLNGNVGIGIGNYTAQARLDLKGAGSTSGTKNFSASNSSATEKFFIRDDGMVSATDGYSIGTTLFMHATWSGTQNMAAYNTFIGQGTGVGATGSGFHNTSIGYLSLNATTTAAGNTAIGSKALKSVTSGGNNVASGLNALLGLTSGAGNVGIGVNALDAITTSSSNVGVGVNAFGALAGASSLNVGIGADTYSTNTLGSTNVGIGYKSGVNITSGSNNTMIGAYAGAGVAGAYSASIAIGRSSWITASNQMVVGQALSNLHINDVYWGAGVSGTTITPTTFKMQVTSITAGQLDNTPNYDFIIAGSQGTGTGVGSDIRFQTAPAGTTGTTQNALVDVMTITGAGNVGIGTDKTTGFKLSVAGKVRAEEIEVSLSSGWADYVFAKDYKLTPLTEVEKYIEENNHLSDVPSAAEVEENGVNLGEMDAILLKKIEELTLYTIEQQKLIEEQGKLIESLIKGN